MHVALSRWKIVLGLVLFLCAPAFASAGTLLPHTPTSSSCATLVRDLKFGMSGNDVRLLQQVLNRSVITQIGTTGSGSPGQESSFFGTRTKAAVVKFQELYKEETLFPAGLEKGTGYFGKLTRTKLIVICKNGPSLAAATPSTPPTLPKTSERLTPMGIGLSGTTASSSVSDTGSTTVMYPDNYMVTPGDTVRLNGSRFASVKNVVHIGDTYTITATKIGSFGTLDFTLPLDVPLGKLALWITNAKGESNKSFLIIKSSAVVTPVIEGITPATGKLGSLITLTGSGFSFSGNEVRFGDVTLSGLSSPDGKTLAFTATSTVFANASKAGTTSPKISLFIYVLNAGGVSNGQPFTLMF